MQCTETGTDESLKIAHQGDCAGGDAGLGLIIAVPALSLRTSSADTRQNEKLDENMPSPLGIEP